MFEEKGKQVGMPQENYVMAIKLDEVEFLTVPEVEELANCLEFWAECMRNGQHYPPGQY